MKLEPSQQDLLLELAEAERLDNPNLVQDELPEQKELTRLLKEKSRLQDAVAAAQMAVDDIENDILRIQADERKLRLRLQDSKNSLETATDLEKKRDLSHDVYSASSRLNDLLGELAEAHNQVHALRSNHELAQTRVAEMDSRIAEVEQKLAARTAELKTKDPAKIIAEIKAVLPADVVSDYEKQRATSGVGVAIFNGRSCSGCSMVLSASAISDIRTTPEDELPHCTECGAYLVRRTN